MRVKAKNFFIGWCLFTILLTILMFSGIYAYSNIVEGTENVVIEDNIEDKQESIKSVEEKNVEIEKVVEDVSYSFPFKVSEEKIVSTIGICDCCLSGKQYSKMMSKDGVTVYASSNLYKEGTLLWIEGVGIRQVQPITINSNSLYIYFNNHNEVVSYGNKSVKVFEILE